MNDIPDHLDDAIYEELHELVMARFEGTITNDQLARLEYLVVNDPQACQLYISYMHETTALYKLLATPEIETADFEQLKESHLSFRFSNNGEPSSGENKATFRYSFRLARYVIAASLLLVAVLIFSSNFKPRTTYGIFTVLRSVNAEWISEEGQIEKYKVGEEIDLKRFTLHRGTATIRSLKGYTVSIDASDGPSDARVIKEQHIQVSKGDVVVKTNEELSRPEIVIDIDDSSLIIGQSSKVGFLIEDEDRGFEVHSFTPGTKLIFYDKSVTHIKANEGFRVNISPTPIPFNHDAFAHLESNQITIDQIGLFHTGDESQTGVDDTNWQVSYTNKEGKHVNKAAQIVRGKHGALVGYDNSSSKWISTDSNYRSVLKGNYLFSTECRIGDLESIRGYSILVDYIADNQLVNVTVNGKLLSFNKSPYHPEQVYRYYRTISIPSSMLIEGVNRIEFDVLNYEGKDGGDETQVAFRAKFSLSHN